MKKWWVGIACALVILSPFCVSGSDSFEMHVIDVGQGDSILIRTPSGSNILIDTGNLSAGYRVRQYLREQGISILHTVVITHMHPDHVGGLFGLAPDLTVEKVCDNGAILTGNDFWEEYINLTTDLKIERAILKSGDMMSFGRVQVSVLSPSQPLTGDMNADSIVLRIYLEKVSFLLMGDADTKTEKRLLTGKRYLKSQVLKVGHHGANDTTSDAFLEAVDPDLAIISVGKDNPRGYPGQQTLDVLKRRGVKVLRTDRDGTVVVRTDGESLSVARQ